MTDTYDDGDVTITPTTVEKWMERFKIIESIEGFMFIWPGMEFNAVKLESIGDGLVIGADAKVSMPNLKHVEDDIFIHETAKLDAKTKAAIEKIMFMKGL